MPDPIRVLVVGQTPPPHHGQAIMIEEMLAGTYEAIELRHVRMEFSRKIEDVGRPNPLKIFHLVVVLWRIARAVVSYRPQVLYYPPAGPTRSAVYRDVIILLFARCLVPHTVYHFHAGGLSQLVSRMKGLERRLILWAYRRPEIAILLSDRNPPDDKAVEARQRRVIPYGIEDHNPEGPRTTGPVRDAPEILFVGAIRESKGVTVLLKACAQLQARDVPFSARFVGGFVDSDFESSTRRRVTELGLEKVVSFSGQLVAEDKWDAYRSADVFCFPTFYEAETFGVVLLEAMQFELPVVATDWRGVPSVVSDGETGYLVPTRDAQALADRLERLLADPGERMTMGRAGRARYLAEFTLERWYRAMESALGSAASTP